MRKSGFTLMEVIVSLFILTILFGTGMSLSKLGRNIYYHIIIEGYVYEVEDLLSYGKAICKKNNQYGKINTNTQTNEITFIERWDNIEKTVVLPKEIKLQKSLTLFINPEGKLEQGNTITLIDKFGSNHDISIRVGVDLIVIKE